MRLVLNGILAAGIVVGVFYALTGLHGCFKDHRTVETIKRSVPAVYDSTRHYRDLYRTEHALRDEVIADKLEADLLYREMLDSVCRRANIKEKQVATLMRALAEAKGDITTVMDTVRDTVLLPGERVATRLRARVEDSLLHGWATYFPDSKRFRLQYELALDLHYTRYWKRRWLLGRKRWYVDVYSERPNVHISGVTGITIK